jgi:hypothetical protein
MIRRSQQDAAQADNVAGDGERDDLASTVPERLETSSPARLQNEGLVAALTFLGEVGAPTHIDAMRLQICKTLQLIFRQ